MSAVSPLPLPQKFCRDCAHAIAGSSAHTTRCGFTYPNMVDLVTGGPKSQPYEFCRPLRETTDAECCGPEGKFYEAMS